HRQPGRLPVDLRPADAHPARARRQLPDQRHPHDPGARPAAPGGGGVPAHPARLGPATDRGARRRGGRGMTIDVLAGVGESFQQTAATGPLLLALGACLLAGLVSFASPCVVPLVPGYLSYLAGLVGAEAPPATVAEAKGKTGSGSSVALAQRAPVKAARMRVAGAAGLFVAGFTVVFVLATATVFGVIQTLNVNRELLMRLGGVVTILMGLV